MLLSDEQLKKNKSSFIFFFKFLFKIQRQALKFYLLISVSLPSIWMMIIITLLRIILNSFSNGFNNKF